MTETRKPLVFPDTKLTTLSSNRGIEEDLEALRKQLNEHRVLHDYLIDYTVTSEDSEFVKAHSLEEAKKIFMENHSYEEVEIDNIDEYNLI